MKSILFKKQMYEAIVAGRKSQTRRIVKGDLPKYKVGDIVYVKEPTLKVPGVSHPHYLYDGVPVGLDMSLCRKVSPLFLQEKYARLYLGITGVRQEYLHDIEDDDAIAEGIETCVYNGEVMYKNYGLFPKADWLRHPRLSFAGYWEDINGKGTWEKPTKVWVYEFVRIIN